METKKKKESQPTEFTDPIDAAKDFMRATIDIHVSILRDLASRAEDDKISQSYEDGYRQADSYSLAALGFIMLDVAKQLDRLNGNLEDMQDCHTAGKKVLLVKSE